MVTAPGYFASTSLAQNSQVDSLRAILKFGKKDTTPVYTLHECLCSIEKLKVLIPLSILVVRRGNGLENMQKRADDIGANLELVTKENEGVSLLRLCEFW